MDEGIIMTDHSEHNSSILPVEGCPDCDREIGRPIIRRFGLGNSSSVIPSPPIDRKEDNGQE